ncbi:MAG: hypothetical protein AAFQ19_02260 [Pseudomonadota bacterium]
MLRCLLLCALSVAPTFAAAQAFDWRKRYDIPVIPIDATSFEVIENDGAGGTQLWCAAGLYARDQLGQLRGSLYVREGRRPSARAPGRRGVVFTLDAVPDAFSSVSEGVRRAGQVFSISHARALCRSTGRLRIEVR